MSRLTFTQPPEYTHPMDPYQDDFDDDTQSAPLTIVGISLKYLLVVVIVITGLLLVFDNSEIDQLVERSLHTLKLNSGEQSTANLKDRTISPTPEELARVMDQLREKKLQEIEQAPPPEPDGEHYYLIVLTNGTTLDAKHLVIQPDRIVLTSPSGIETILNKEDVSSISRHTLTPPPAHRQ